LVVRFAALRLVVRFAAALRFVVLLRFTALRRAGAFFFVAAFFFLAGAFFAARFFLAGAFFAAFFTVRFFVAFRFAGFAGAGEGAAGGAGELGGVEGIDGVDGVDGSHGRGDGGVGGLGGLDGPPPSGGLGGQVDDMHRSLQQDAARFVTHAYFRGMFSVTETPSKLHSLDATHPPECGGCAEKREKFDYEKDCPQPQLR
jgi:hypothetical protein